MGWLLTVAGFHPITMYNSTLFVADSDPERGGPVVDVVARLYGLPAERVQALARTNDDTPAPARVDAVRRELDRLLESHR